MGDILIRDVEDDVVQRLKSKADINGTSLQVEARRALSRGSPLSPDERMAVFAELDTLWGDRLPVDVSGADIVREVREESER